MARQPHVSKRFGHIIGIGVFIVAALIIVPARAQSATTPPRTAAQLEQLVAPIALYPDALLSQVLMAATYPLEVVAAARWSQANPMIKGDALQTAMAQQLWDPSVKALTAVPQTLRMMNEKLDWTQQLGDAFLAQQSELLDVVQRLRARADANGQLKSTPEQRVTITPRGGGQQPSTAAPANVYAMEPTNPEEYYVPVYEPGAVYGTWPYPDYAPFYWYPPGYAFGNVFSFAAGVFVGSAIWGNVNWFQNRVQINPLRYNNFNRTNITNINWAHNPAHRGAVPYRDANVAQRFGNQAQSAAREGFRQKAGAGQHGLANQGGTNAANRAKQATGAKTTANRKQTASSKNATRKSAGAKQAGSKHAGAKQGAGSRQATRQRSAGQQSSPKGNVRAPSAGINRAGGGRSVGMSGGGTRSAGEGGGFGGARGSF